MTAVFISYRRADGGYAASRCYSYLVERLGAGQVVLDHQGMTPGTRYPDWLRAQLTRSVVLVAIIDRNWVGRLTDKGDWVCHELTHAIRHEIPIIPVLLDDVPLPTDRDLPESLREVSRRQYTWLRQHDMEDDLQRIADAVFGEAPQLVLVSLFGAETAFESPTLPTAMLRPERKAVPFHGRQREWETLTEWAGSGPPLSVGLLMGGAGAGKTRLALELCHSLGKGWAAGAVDGGWDADRLGRLAGLQVHLLLVVDRAESKVGLISEILAMLVTEKPRARVRVLLVARSDGPWFGQLREAPDDRVQALVGRARVWPVGPLLAPADFRSAEFERAAAAFAGKLDSSVPAATPDLSGPAYDDVLSVHAAALAAVLGARPPAEEDPLDQILRYEQDYWLSTAPVGLPASAQRGRCRQVVAAVTLCGPRTREETRVLLQALPTFESVDGGTLDAWVDWVRQLYPASAGRSGLTPEPLAERFVAGELAERPGLATRCAAVATDDQLRRIFALTGRVATNDIVRILLDPPSDRRVAAAVSAAGELADPTTLLAVLSAVISDPDASVDLARSVIDRLPDGSRALAPLAIDTIAVALDALRARSELDLPVAAYLRTNLAARLLMRSRTGEAAVAADEAVTIYRALSVELPEKYAVPLATALGNQALARLEDGGPEAALGPAEEAFDLFRAARPSGLRGLVKIALLLATVYRRSDRPADALAALRAAADVARSLAATDPDSDDDRALLADVLENLALALAGSDAAAAAAEMRMSVATREPLAHRRPDPHRPAWVRGLVVQAGLELRVDREAARRTVARAVDEARMLATPVALADALLMSSRIREAAEREAAGDDARAAVELYEEIPDQEDSLRAARTQLRRLDR